MGVETSKLSNDTYYKKYIKFSWDYPFNSPLYCIHAVAYSCLASAVVITYVHHLISCSLVL
jgi:hypothetical protein